MAALAVARLGLGLVVGLVVERKLAGEGWGRRVC